MSNGRSLFWLTLVTVAAVTANVLLSICQGNANSSAKRISLLDVDSDVTCIRLLRKNERPIALVNSDGWKITAPYNAAASTSAVLKLLDVLTTYTPKDVISEDELLKLGRVREDFGLNTPQMTLELEIDGGTTRLDFGAVTAMTNGVYASVRGSGLVFIMPMEAFSALDLYSAEFRRREVFSCTADSVQRMELRCPARPVISLCKSAEGWTSEGSTASERCIKELLQAFTTVNAEKFIWPTGETNESSVVTTSLLASYGLDSDNAAQIVFVCENGRELRLSLGGASETGSVYALADGDEAIVTVDASLKALVTSGRDHFVETRLFPFEASQVSAFSIADKHISCALARVDGRWRLDSPLTAPAQSETVEKILGGILALTSSDVCDDGISVSVGTNTAPITVVRREVMGELQMEDLRSKDILTIDRPLLRRLTVFYSDDKKRGASVVYSRDNKTWNAEGEYESYPVDMANIELMLETLCPLKASQIVSLKNSASDMATYGLEKPYCTIAIDHDYEGAFRRNLLIGDSTRNGRYATVGTSESVFVISNEDLDKIFNDIIIKK